MADLSKDTYKKALATVLGIETLRPGTVGAASRKALVSGTRAILAGTVRYAPAAARTTGRAIGGLTPQGRLILGGLTVAEAYNRGLLDAPIARGSEAFEETVVSGLEAVRPFMPQSGPPEGFEGFGVGKPRKKKPSKYNKAVKAGMAAVKASKFGGKKGTISNAKSTFATVNRTISAKKKGRKAPKSGIRRTIWNATRGIL
jgi:hypothetical protein